MKYAPGQDRPTLQSLDCVNWLLRFVMFKRFATITEDMLVAVACCRIFS